MTSLVETRAMPASPSIRRRDRRGSRSRSLASFILAAFSVGCCLVTAQASDLVIAMPNWPSGQATANILKVAIKAEFGLDAEVREMGALNSFAGIEAGTVAIHPEVWQPNYNDIIRRYVTEKRVAVLTRHAVSAWQGLCANAAASNLGIKSVADLEDPAKTGALDTDGDGKGEIWIGATAWLSTGIERVRANSYGYSGHVTLVETEEDVAMAAVDAAEATNQPMVFYCYSPHHLFKLHKISRIAEPAFDAAKWKLADPSDPLWISKSSAAVAWDAASLHIAYGAGFASTHPQIARFLENVDLTEEEVTQMSYALQVERQLPFDYATLWVKDHKARIDGWAKP